MQSRSAQPVIRSGAVLFFHILGLLSVSEKPRHMQEKRNLAKAGACLSPQAGTPSSAQQLRPHSSHLPPFLLIKNKPPASRVKQTATAGADRSPIHNTTPRSLQRRTGGLLLDRIFQYCLPLAFFGYRSDAWEQCWGNGKLRFANP